MVIFLTLLVVVFAINQPWALSLNILIVSSPMIGHVSRPIALGEELVLRGHNVSFCSVDSFMKTKDKVTERGMQYISAGQLDNGNETEQRINQNELTKILTTVSISSFHPATFKRSWSILLNTSGIPILTEYFLNVDFQQWDIVILEQFTFHSLPCIIKKNAGIPMVGVTDYLAIDTQPWPSPQIMTGFSDNVDFSKRLVLSFRPIVDSFFYLIFSVHPAGFFFGDIKLAKTLCKEVFHWYPHEGWEYPLIITTMMGLEFPRTVSPMADYVGPILSQRAIDQSLPKDIDEWLQDKKKQTVIYISMGSFVTISREMAEAFVNGTSHSKYSVIWSLNKHSQSVISDLKLDKTKYLISSWTPQVRLLQHHSISMAILHGGSNGVHEALYYGVPCIILPQFGDQYDWAARVADAGVGVQLLRHEVTPSAIKESIEEIESGDYRSKANKMKMIMRRGGGAKKAAEIIEYYGVVGYDHLLAAPIKYKWNWIQYYNIDVYITLIIIALAFMWLLVTVFRYFYRFCCKLLCKKKIKQN